MNRIRLVLARVTAAILVMVLSSFAIVSATGCAAILPAIPVVASALTDAAMILQIIDSTVQSFFNVHPNTPPEIRQKYTNLYTRAIESVNIANHALKGIDNVTQKDADAAFSEFRAAYVELRDFLLREGLMAGSQLKAGDGTVVEIPEPEALTLKVD